MASEAKETWIHRARGKPHVKVGNNSVMGSHLVAASAEFVGTFFFLWLSYGGQLMVLTQAAAPAGTGGGASSETVVFISLIYSISLLVNAWAFYRISGGLFNPAASPRTGDEDVQVWTDTLTRFSRLGLSRSKSCRAATVDPDRFSHTCAAACVHVRRRSRGRYV